MLTLKRCCFHKISNVIFNIDGVLLNTDPILKAIMREIAHISDTKYTDALHKKLLNMPENIIAKIAIAEMRLPYTEEQFMLYFERAARDKYRKAKLFRGADQLLRHLRHHGVQVAVATNSCKEMVDLKCAYNRKTFDLIKFYIYGAELKDSSQASDIYKAAMKRFYKSPKPSHCLVIESSVEGAKAALDAEMQVVLISPSGITIPGVKTLREIDDFRPDTFGLPPFPICRCT